MLDRDARVRQTRCVVIVITGPIASGKSTVARARARVAPDARLRDHLDQEVAAGMLTEHLGGRADLSRRMWLLLAFELWARRWLEVGVRA